MSPTAESGDTPTPVHLPVLVDEVLTYLAPRPGAVIVDATIGEGGHGEALLRRIAPAGRLIGLDRDADAVRRAEERLRSFGRNGGVRHASFADCEQALDGARGGHVVGVQCELEV